MRTNPRDRLRRTIDYVAKSTQTLLRPTERTQTDGENAYFLAPSLVTLRATVSCTLATRGRRAGHACTSRERRSAIASRRSALPLHALGSRALVTSDSSAGVVQCVLGHSSSGAACGMTTNDIPVDLKTFLRERIRSYDDLELLALFHRTAPRAWRADAVARQLNIARSAASEAIEHLRGSALLELVTDGEETAFRYSPSTPELARLAGQLIDLFDNEGVALVKSMNENAVARMRSGVRRLLLESLSGKGKAAS